MLIRTDRLADEFYLLAHDEHSGRCLLPARVAGLGMASALLGELILGGYIGLWTGRVASLRVEPPKDPLNVRTAVAIAREEQRPVRDWLLFLAQSATDSVARRLADSGLLAQRASRIPLRRGCLAPTESNNAAIISALLCTRLVRNEPLDDKTALLAGLARATGLERDHPGLWEVRDRPTAQEYLNSVLASLPSSGRQLISQTEAAIAAAIATHRV